MQNDKVTLENSLVVSDKVKHTLIIWLSNPTLKYCPTENENPCPHINLYINIYSRLIHNHKKLEITQNMH